jgi:hypothetical protein
MEPLYAYRAAFEELKDFNAQITSFTYKGENYGDFCYQINDACYTSESPLSYVYDQASNSYDLSAYTSDSELLTKIQSGRGDLSIYQGDGSYIKVTGLFGKNTEPEEVTQDEASGVSDVSKVCLIIWSDNACNCLSVFVSFERSRAREQESKGPSGRL